MTRPTLTVADPCVDHDVLIILTLPATAQPRPARPVLVSLGVAGQPPVLKQGVLAEVGDLIEAAWQTFAEGGTDLESQVLADDAVEDDDSPTAVAPEKTHLTLF